MTATLSIPPEIIAECGSQLDSLTAAGYRVVDAKYSPASFGNWYVDLEGPVAVRIVKDRSQYSIDPVELAQRADLFRAFDDPTEFWAATLGFLLQVREGGPAFEGGT